MIHVCEEIIAHPLKFIKTEHLPKLPEYADIIVTRLLNSTVKIPNLYVPWTSFPPLSDETDGFRSLGANLNESEQSGQAVVFLFLADTETLHYKTKLKDAK